MTAASVVVLDEHRAGAGGGEQHVGVGQRVGQLARAARHGRRRARPARRRRSSVRLATTISADAGAGQRDGHALAHLAGADHEHLAAGQRARGAPSAISTAACDTDAVPRPMPVSVRARLPTSSGVAEQQVERGPGRALALGQLPRVADLAEDLGLAEHGRVEPGGHLEQVRGTASSS